MVTFEETDIKTVGAVIACIIVILGYVIMVYVGVDIPETLDNLIYIVVTFLFGIGSMSVALSQFSKFYKLQKGEG